EAVGRAMVVDQVGELKAVAEVVVGRLRSLSDPTGQTLRPGDAPPRSTTTSVGTPTPARDRALVTTTLGELQTTNSEARPGPPITGPENRVRTAEVVSVASRARGIPTARRASEASARQRVQVAIPNSSLASQAVAPALSDFEMSCGGLSPRSFPDLGRKLLRLKALASQKVSRDDSVLGKYANRSGKGLKLSYMQMVQKAFHEEYWNDRRRVGDGEFRQMEANFALFWGLAIQMYEATLVSEQTRFDEFARGNNDALTAEEKLGLQVFLDPNGGRCADCHAGPEFTAASVRMAGAHPVERMIMGDGTPALYDTGFYNIGVRGTLEDLGLGANLLELNGQPVPLSIARQLSEQLLVDVTGDENVVEAELPELAGPAVPGERVAVDGAFKTPSLRNVELTAPYFHNGGHLTLEQVVRFYKDQALPFFAQENMQNLAEGMTATQAGAHPDAGIQISGGDIDALVAFMKTLTDDRVRLEKAPFDHPELIIPNGHELDESMVFDTDGNGEADDSFIVIPAVGEEGVATPARGFLE
ncbi:MAG: hypothetical protein RI897_4624, partial [Verrucomicrobiota bacterium]